MCEENRTGSKNTSNTKNFRDQRPTHLNITISIPLPDSEKLSDVLANLRKKVLKPCKKKHKGNLSPTLNAVAKLVKKKVESLALDNEHDVSKEINTQVQLSGNCEKNRIHERSKCIYNAQHSSSNDLQNVGSYTSFISNLINHRQDTNSKNTLTISQPTQTTKCTSKCDEIDVKYKENIDTQSVMLRNNIKNYSKDIEVLHDLCIENNFLNTIDNSEKLEKNIGNTINKIDNNVSIKETSDYVSAMEINREDINISEPNDKQGHLQIVADIKTTKKSLINNESKAKKYKSKKRALALLSESECVSKRKCKDISLTCEDEKLLTPLQTIDSVLFEEKESYNKKYPEDIENNKKMNKACDVLNNDKILTDATYEENAPVTEKEYKSKSKTGDTGISIQKEKSSNDTLNTPKEHVDIKNKNNTIDNSTRIDTITNANDYLKYSKKRSSEDVSHPSKIRKKNDSQMLSNSNSVFSSHEFEKSVTEEFNLKECIASENRKNKIEPIDISETGKNQIQNKKKTRAAVSNTGSTKKVKTKVKKCLTINEDSSEDEEKDFAGIMEYLKEYVGNENNFTTNRNKVKNSGKNKSSSKITSCVKLEKLDSSDSSSDSSLSAYTRKLNQSCQVNKKKYPNKIAKELLENHNATTKVDADDFALDTKVDIMDSKSNNDIRPTTTIAENGLTPEFKECSNRKNKKNIGNCQQETTNPQQHSKKQKDIENSKPSQKIKINTMKFLLQTPNSKVQNTGGNSKSIKSEPDTYVEVEETKVYLPEIKENEQMVLGEADVSRNKQKSQKEGTTQYTSLEDDSECHSSQNEISNVDKGLCNSSDSKLKRKAKHYAANDSRKSTTKDSQRLVCDYFDRVLTERFKNKEKRSSRSAQFILNSSDSSSATNGITDGITDFETEKEQKDSDVEKRKTKILEIISYADDHMINVLEENEQLRKLDINISWDVPISHTIETRISSCPTKSQQQLFKDLNIKLKNGPFTRIEDETIKKNFEDFCKQHGLNHDPVPFLNFQYGNVSMLNAKQRIGFGRYLGKGMENRKLHCIYSRFKTLYSTFTKGRFTPEEDAVISEYMTLIGNGKNQYSMLSKLLNRPRPLIEKRYKLLQRKSEMLYPKHYPLLLQQLIHTTKSKNLEDLKRKEITDEHWMKISKKMNIHQHHLKVCWKSSLFTKLFHDGPIRVDKIMRKLINTLDKNEEDDYRKLNWTKLVEPFNNITREFLYRIFKKTIKSKVPPHLHTNLRKCVLYLKNVYAVNTSVMSDINKIQVELEYDS